VLSVHPLALPHNPALSLVDSFQGADTILTNHKLYLENLAAQKALFSVLNIKLRGYSGEKLLVFL
jgi:hypothetical protein